MFENAGVNQARSRRKPVKTIRGLGRWRILGTIRNKIILPFLLVTLAVTMLGAFVVTRLVAANIQDRLTNQVLETSRATSDSIVDWEQGHLDTLRLVVFTVGMPDALRDNRVDEVAQGLGALAANQEVYTLIGMNGNGVVVADAWQDSMGYQTGLLAGQDLSGMPMVRHVLNGDRDQYGDKYAGVTLLADEYLLLTVAPVHDATGQLVGAIAIGTPLENVLSKTKADVLADITLYDESGQTLATTFLLTHAADSSALNITRATYEAALEDPENSTPMRHLTVNQRQYQAAFVPLRIRRDMLGVLGVSWPTSIVTSMITTNRNVMSIVFALVSMLVVLVGFVVAQSLTAPIRRLAETASAVSAGDLNRQSGVRTADEIGVLGRTFDNMTLRLQAQTRAIQMEAAFLREVIASSADGTAVIAQSGKVTHANPFARETFASNKVLWQDTLARLVRLVQEQETAQERVEISNRWFDALAAPVVTSSGEEVGVVVTIRDVTEQVLNERMRTAFILQMSHELFTPLSAFKGYAELAKAVLDGEAPQACQYLQEAINSAGIVSQMITQMLDVAGMMRGGFEITRQPVDLVSVVRASVMEHRDLMEEKNLELQMHLGQLDMYNGDGDRLKWAISHLVKNACDYTMPGGKVSIFATNGDGWCNLHVSDTGVGIAPSEQRRVFEQFYRGYPVAPDGTEIDVRGTGLGLFIVDQIIRAHGGCVEVQSKMGEGSEFTIKLPLYTADNDITEMWNM